MPINERLIKIFEYALNQEETGKSFFQRSLQRMGVGAAVSAFKRLMEEEEKHILFITKILEDLRKGEEIELPADKDVVLEPTDYFDERARSEFLQQCVEVSMVPDVTVFNTACLIEKDLSEFYQRMAKTIPRAKPKRFSRCFQRGKRIMSCFSVSTAICSPRHTPECPGAVNLLASG